MCFVAVHIVHFTSSNIFAGKCYSVWEKLASVGEVGHQFGRGEPLAQFSHTCTAHFSHIVILENLWCHNFHGKLIYLLSLLNSSFTVLDLLLYCISLCWHYRCKDTLYGCKTYFGYPKIRFYLPPIHPRCISGIFHCVMGPKEGILVSLFSEIQ